MASADSLGDRMKAYEHAWRFSFPRRVPIIIRVDGKAFHTLTRGCARPFDETLMLCMDRVAVALCEEIQGAQLAYVQSDEVSVLVHGYRSIQSEPWFGNELQKMTSVSAAVATEAFNRDGPFASAHFDSRVFVVPEDEVCNYFIWRQQDATRNSIQMVAQARFSARELHGKNTSDMQEMLFSKVGINWNDYAIRLKRGRCAVRSVYEREGATRHQWTIDNEIPVFSQAREYIERHVEIHRSTETYVQQGA